MDLSIDIAIEDDAWLEQLGSMHEIDALAERAIAAALVQVKNLQVAALTPGAELSLMLCDDATIRALNKRWRGKDKATNVLSFPSPKATRAATLGDIVIAYETSAREAAEHGTSLADYVSHLMIHGFFHLCGFDHETAHDAELMEAAESRALAALGIASPYVDSLSVTAERRAS